MREHARESGTEPLQLLERIRERLAQQAEPRKALDAAASELAREPGVQRMLFAVRHTQDRTIRIEASAGFSADELRRGYYHSGDGVIGGVVERGQPSAGEMVAGRAQRSAGIWPPRAASESLRYVCAPVVSRRSGVIGAVGMDRVLPATSWQRDDVQLLRLVAAMAADLVLALREQREESSERDRDQARLQRSAGDRLDGLWTESSGMRETLELVRQVAPSNAIVLLIGESGVGKAMLAREIHARSPCAGLPFVAINCGAAASQRLVHELLDRACEPRPAEEHPAAGSLFFDDISELPKDLQAQLTRFLHAVDGPRGPRVIAATQADLEDAVHAGRLREDLYYRLTAFPIRVPPLRERTADIPQLAATIAARAAATHRKPPRDFAPDALAALARHDWPGNVRELENTVVRAVLSASGAAVSLADLPREVRAAPTSELASEPTLKDQVAAFERGLIAAALREAGGNRIAAARALQITPRILSYRMQRLGVEPA